MTPEAIRALLKKEIGDYQALSIAVGAAKGSSESAITEVENLRHEIENLEFDFDTTEYDKAMKTFEKNMEELEQSLNELAEESLVRKNKLAALELALKQDRTKFNQAMLDMVRELQNSKQDLDATLEQAKKDLSANVTEVGERLSEGLKNANKTISEDLAKDLAKLNTDLTEAFGRDLKSLETRQNSKTDRLDKELKNYKSNTDSKVSTLLSEIDKAKAFADGFLQPGNLVWNPRALDNARYITANNNGVKIESVVSVERDGGVLKARKTGTSFTYIDYGASQNSTFELKNGDVIIVSAWIRSSMELPPKAIALCVGYVASSYYNPNKIPANKWVRISGEVEYKGGQSRASYFSVFINRPTPQNANVFISEPHAQKKVTSDLIVDGAVTSKSLATGAVTAGKIAADAVTANNIAAGAVNADKIAANAIGADQLAANAVTADKIAANAVDADKIKAKSIGSDQLAANAVTTEKLAAKAVQAGNIDANAVTAQKIASEAINGGHIQANSIDTTKMTIMPGNLFPDPHFKDNCWGTSGNVYAATPNGGELRFFPNNTQIGRYYQPSGRPDKGMMLEKDSVYRITANVYGSKNIPPNSQIDIYMRCPGSNNKINVHHIGHLPVVAGTRVVSAMVTTPKDMTRSECTIGFYVNKPRNGGQYSMWDVHMTRAADASLIVKGGVKADHIDAGAVTTKHMSANTINGDRIQAGTLNANRIQSKTLTSDHVTFKDGYIKNAMIGNGEITSGKIKQLDAGKITTGTMHGDRIQAGTLNANRIKAGTLSANQITSGTLSSDRIAADSITVKQLRAGTIVPLGGSLIHSEPKVSGGVPEPIWWQACDKELPAGYSGWPRPEGHPWRSSSGAIGRAESPFTPKRLMKVQPGQKYKLKLWLRATVPDSKLFIELRDQNGALTRVYGAAHTGRTAVKYVHDKTNGWDIADFSKDMQGKPIPPESAVSYSYLVNNYTVHTYPTLVTSTVWFEPHVEYVYLARFFFNHPNSSARGNQWLAGLSLDLDIPDQAQIDALQTKQISDNKARIAENKARITDNNARIADIENLNKQTSEATAYSQDLAFAAISMLTEKVYTLESSRMGFHLLDENGSTDMVSRPSRSKLVAKGSWVGKLVWITWDTDYSGGATVQRTNCGMEVVGDKREFSIQTGFRYPVLVLWERYPMRIAKRSLAPTNPYWDAPRITYTTIPGMTVIAPHGAKRMEIDVKVTFTNVNRGSVYGVRIVADGKELTKWVSSKFGPIGPSGNPTWWTKVNGIFDVKPGQTISVQVYASNTDSSKRRVLGVDTSATAAFHVET